MKGEVLMLVDERSMITRPYCGSVTLLCEVPEEAVHLRASDGGEIKITLYMHFSYAKFIQGSLLRVSSLNQQLPRDFPS